MQPPPRRPPLKQLHPCRRNRAVVIAPCTCDSNKDRGSKP